MFFHALAELGTVREWRGPFPSILEARDAAFELVQKYVTPPRFNTSDDKFNPQALVDFPRFAWRVGYGVRVKKNPLNPHSKYELNPAQWINLTEYGKTVEFSTDTETRDFIENFEEETGPCYGPLKEDYCDPCEEGFQQRGADGPPGVYDAVVEIGYYGPAIDDWTDILGRQGILRPGQGPKLAYIAAQDLAGYSALNPPPSNPFYDPSDLDTWATDERYSDWQGRDTSTQAFQQKELTGFGDIARDYFFDVTDPASFFATKNGFIGLTFGGDNLGLPDWGGEETETNEQGQWFFLGHEVMIEQVFVILGNEGQTLSWRSETFAGEGLENIGEWGGDANRQVGGRIPESFYKFRLPPEEWYIGRDWLSPFFCYVQRDGDTDPNRDIVFGPVPHYACSDGGPQPREPIGLYYKPPITPEASAPACAWFLRVYARKIFRLWNGYEECTVDHAGRWTKAVFRAVPPVSYNTVEREDEYGNQDVYEAEQDANNLWPNVEPLPEKRRFIPGICGPLSEEGEPDRIPEVYTFKRACVVDDGIIESGYLRYTTIPPQEATEDEIKFSRRVFLGWSGNGLPLTDLILLNPEWLFNPIQAYEFSDKRNRFLYLMIPLLLFVKGIVATPPVLTKDQNGNEVYPIPVRVSNDPEEFGPPVFGEEEFVYSLRYGITRRVKRPVND